MLETSKLENNGCKPDKWTKVTGELIWNDFDPDDEVPEPREAVFINEVGTGQPVDEISFAGLADKYGIVLEHCFEINPDLVEVCSNAEHMKMYCVEGCKFNIVVLVLKSLC